VKNMDKSVFRMAFGDSPIIKLIDFLIDSPEFDFSMTEISKETGISWITLNKLFPVFEKLGIIMETRQIGRARMYMINKNSPITRYWISIHTAVVDKYYEAEETEQAVTTV